MDLEGGDGRAVPWSSGRVGSEGKKKGRWRKRLSNGWAYIQLSRATGHGATQSRQHMWRDSALPRQLSGRGRSSVAAWSHQSMWRDSLKSHATCFGATKLPHWNVHGQAADVAADVARLSRATCVGATESRHAPWRDSAEYRHTRWTASSSTSLSFFLHSPPDLSSMAPPVAVPL